MAMKKSRPVRDPERTRRRVLAAAVAEFAARGFAGARVDAIARRAGTNKRMLYHYFGNKERLFRAVLRWKITERRALLEGAPGAPEENLPFRFELMCRDRDWVRLLAWEALQPPGKSLVEEKFRRQGVERALARVRREQPALDARYMMLARLALVMFPVAFPNSTRLITGRSIRDSKFRREYAAFLRKFAAVFRPAGQRENQV
jgi:TetR/AcrR family transcriptional regulator